MSQFRRHAPLTGSELLDDMVELIGWDAVLAFVRSFGGQQVYIPEKLRGEDDPLIRAVGRSAAETICAHHFRTVLYVPLPLRREAEVHALLNMRPPLTANEIAAKVGVSCRYVNKVARKPARATTLAARRAAAPHEPDLLDLLRD